MFRIRRLAATPAMLQLSQRCYTPIYHTEPTSSLHTLRQVDEANTLWQESPPVSSVSAGLKAWLRMGNDPVLHTALPAELGSSPFRFAEDYMGTNLVTGTQEHVSESIAMWNSFFSIQYAGRLRQSRRTSANYIGPVNAPLLFTDEADQPGTKWAKDTVFGEISYLLERKAKEKVGNLLDLEKVLYTKADPEQFLSLFESFLPQTQTRIPLPAPSVWFYEGDAKKLWVETYVPIAHSAHTFFADILAPEVKKANDGGKALLEKLAAAYAEVGAVLLKRAERQVKAGIRPDWSKATKQEKLAWAAVEMDVERRAMLNGVFDPENEKDPSDDWKRENESINAILEKKLDGVPFTLKDFWLHTFRREAMETQHVLEEQRLLELGAAARARLYDETPLPTLVKDMTEVITKGQLDLRAAVFRPYFNDTFSKLEYVKFGGSSIVQHTRTASRELLFHYLSSPREVAAAAKLYYATKPMSSAIDYTSPYTYRKTLVALCAEYGLDHIHARHYPTLASADHIATAESWIQRIQNRVAVPYGVARRARQRKAQLGYQRLLQPITDVFVGPIPSELLETGAEEDAITATSLQRAAAIKEPIPAWPLGSRQAVHYRWAASVVDAMRRVCQAGPTTAERALELRRLQSQCRLEISLWKKVDPAEEQAKRAAEEKEAQAVQAQLKRVPELAEVEQYAKRFYDRMSHEAPSKEAEKEEWTFVVMLDDNALVNVENVSEVFLPFTDSKGSLIKEGQYKIRVRVYDKESALAASASEEDASVGDPSVCSEAFSAPISVIHPLPQLIESFFKGSKVDRSTRVKGEDLIPLCAALREEGIEVPWQLEFETGQRLDAKGTFSLDFFMQALEGNQYHHSLAEKGITEVQRRVEAKVRSHWTLSHPGANEAEWAEARRAVLDYALDKERDWWVTDPILEVNDVVTASATHRSLEPINYPSTVRYSQEVCGVLAAEGTATAGPQTPSGYVHALNPATENSPHHLQAQASVDGLGQVQSLTFSGTSASSGELDMASVLAVATKAINQAKLRHASLSAFKVGPMEKQSQARLFCGADQTEFGGKYARTFAYALEKGKEELEELLAEGKAAMGAKDWEKERVSEKEEVDRFASSTHPEQRKTRFVPRVTLSGQNIEDPTPDQTSTYNRQ